MSRSILMNDERAVYSLRKLYRAYGYLQYKVNKFEEYDLYAMNKSFLVSDKVLTFTDTNGKLMALKPDVTLSIVKNIAPSGEKVSKYYYDERVYRPATESNGFKEIMQTGLECIGKVTMYDECEVIMLAAKSLAAIGEDYILDLSHMGFLEGLFEEAGIEASLQKSLSKLLESKNTFGIKKLCAEKGIDEAFQSKLCLLSETYLPMTEALVAIKPLVLGKKMQEAYEELFEIARVMALYGVADKLYLDFSMLSDQNYYNGVIFKGFLRGIPDSVLSGGRYDKLLVKLGKQANAIGFAMYLDRLERYGADEVEFDVDVMLVYCDGTAQEQVIKAVQMLSEEGQTVLAVTKADPSVRYRTLSRLESGEANK